MLLQACAGAAVPIAKPAAGTPLARSLDSMLAPEATPVPYPTLSLEPSPLPPASVNPVPPRSSPPGRSLLPADMLGVEWTRLPTSRKVVALTFDAGSMAQGVPSILDTLRREHVPGTFFLTGRWVTSYPALAKEIGDTAGNSIGNHTFDHADLRGLSDAQVVAEISDGERWIQAKTGRRLQPLFRFPYGGSDPRLLAIANRLGYGSIRWTVDTLGWKGVSAGQSVGTVYQRAVGAAEPGEILLMHVGASPDGSTLDADALGRVIDELRRRGYGFVAVGDFL